MLPEVVVDFQYGTSLVSRYWYTSGCSKLPFCRLFSAETVATSEAAETSVPSAESTPTRGIRGIPNPRIRAQVITSASTLRWDSRPACPLLHGNRVVMSSSTLSIMPPKQYPVNGSILGGVKSLTTCLIIQQKAVSYRIIRERKCNRKRRYERNHQHECERAATQATRNTSHPQRKTPGYRFFESRPLK